MVLLKTRKRRFAHLDKTLGVITLLLLLLGILALFSASAAIGVESGDSGFFVRRQIIAIFIGLVLLFIGYKIDYRVWQRWSLLIFGASVLLLILVFIPGLGVAGQGAQRWINLGLLTFQPAELVKLTLILYLSAWIMERGSQTIRNFRFGAVPFTAILLLLFFLILKQPDLGTFIVICAIGLVLYFVGGANLKHFFSLIFGGAVLLAIAVKIAPYRMQRILAFLNPGLDPLGAGYHIQQAIMAIGSGGLFGVGLGHSQQKFFYLPEVVGDSLFAVIAEELGFFASLILIILFLTFFKHGLTIASRAPDDYGRLLAIGIVFWITFQAFINIGAMLGVLPLTGIPLPLMSFGGSAMVVSLAAIGILLNIAKQSRV